MVESTIVVNVRLEQLYKYSIGNILGGTYNFYSRTKFKMLSALFYYSIVPQFRQGFWSVFLKEMTRSIKRTNKNCDIPSLKNHYLTDFDFMVFPAFPEILIAPYVNCAQLGSLPILKVHTAVFFFSEYMVK